MPFDFLSNIISDLFICGVSWFLVQAISIITILLFVMALGFAITIRNHYNHVLLIHKYVCCQMPMNIFICAFRSFSSFLSFLFSFLSEPLSSNLSLFPYPLLFPFFRFRRVHTKAVSNNHWMGFYSAFVR